MSTMPIMVASVLVLLLAGSSMASTPVTDRHGQRYRPTISTSSGFQYQSNDRVNSGSAKRKKRIKRRSLYLPAAVGTTTSTDPNARKANSNSDQKMNRIAEIRRRAAKGTKSTSSGGGEGKGSYAGCQQLTCDELVSVWMFPSDMPPCPGHVQKYSYEDDSCEAWKSTGKGGGKRKGGEGGGGKGSGKGGGGGDNNYSGPGGGGDSSQGGGGQGDDNYNNGGDNGANEGNGNRDDGNDDGGGEGAGDGGGNNNDATSNFDIAVCESYSSFWLWDLALTCDSTESLEGCDCMTAENLMSSGLLNCPEDGGYSCPTDCPVCSTCLILLGCAGVKDSSSGVVSADMSESVPYAAAAVVAVGFVALLIYREKKRQDKIGVNGGSNGIGKDPYELGEFPTPYVAAPIYGETGPLVGGVERSGQGDNVWLTPVD